MSTTDRLLRTTGAKFAELRSLIVRLFAIRGASESSEDVLRLVDHAQQMLEERLRFMGGTSESVEDCE